MHRINRSTAFTIAAIVALSAAAGCLGSQQDSVGGADGRDGAPAIDQVPPGPVELTGCIQHEAFFEIPASEAEPYLPDGFEPVGAGGEPLPAGTAVLFVESIACEGTGEGEASNHLWVDIMVDPPAAYENDQTIFHFIPVTGVTTNQTLAATWAAWGIPRVSPGDIQFEVLGDPPLVVDTETLANRGGDGLRFATSVQGPQVELRAGEVRLFGVEDGQVTGIVDFSYSASDAALGEATLENDGLLPFDVRGSGAGGQFEGADKTYRYVEPPERLELVACAEHFGTFTTSASELAPYLPHGFRPVGVEGEPLPEGRAALVVLGFTCERPERAPQLSVFMVEIPVDAPEPYAREDAQLHFVHVLAVVSDPSVQETYAAWGIPAMGTGDVRFEIDGEGLMRTGGEVQASHGWAAATLATTVAGTAEDVPGGVTRFFGVADREVTGMMDWHYTDFNAAGGGATLEDDGLVPIPVDGPGVGILGTDAASEFRVVALPPS